MIAIGFAIASDPEHLIQLVGFTLALFAALAVGSVFVFRARGQVAASRTPGYPVTPLIFMALSLWTLYFGISSQPRLSIEIATVLIVGTAIYLVTSRSRARSV